MIKQYVTIMRKLLSIVASDAPNEEKMRAIRSMKLTLESLESLFYESSNKDSSNKDSN